MRYPSVLIFTPIYDEKDYCLDEFIGYADKISYPNKRHIIIDNSKTKQYYYRLKGLLEPKGYEVYHVDRGNNSREALTRAQNFAREIAINEGYDYLFSLESDIMVPDYIIQALMAHGLDVVSGLYFIGDRAKRVRVPCITVRRWNETLGAWGSRLLEPEEFPEYTQNGLKAVHAAGMGACLIYKRVFKEVAYTYDPRFQGHSDVYFFNNMFIRSIPVAVDTDMICDHHNSRWEDVEDR